MHETSVMSDLSIRSKFINDGAKTIHNLHEDGQLCYGEGAYDKMAKKSLLDLSIRTGQSIEELLQNNT